MGKEETHPVESNKTEEPKKTVASESEEELSKSSLSHKMKKIWANEESPYYLSFASKFREENGQLMILSVILSAFVLLCCGLLPQIALQNVALDIGLFLMALAGLSFLATSALTVLSNAWLIRFINLIRQKTVVLDKKQVLLLFHKGYGLRQISKILWLSGIIECMFFLLCYLANFSIILTCCIFTILAGLSYWLWQYLKVIEKLGFRLPRKPIPMLDEDFSQVLPPEISIDQKKSDGNVILPSIQALLHSTSEKVRKDAIKILGRIGSLESVQILVTLLGDPSPIIRTQAVAALGKIGDKSVKDALYCLLGDDVSEVRVAVIDALGHLRDEDSGELLLPLLEDSSPEMRGAVAEALGNLGHKKSIKALVNHLNDADWFVRYKTIIALGKMKLYLSSEAISKLMQCVHDENSYARSSAVHALQKIAEDMSHNDPLYQELQKKLANASQETSEDTQLNLDEQPAQDKKADTNPEIIPDKTTPAPVSPAPTPSGPASLASAPSGPAFVPSMPASLASAPSGPAFVPSMPASLASAPSAILPQSQTTEPVPPTPVVPPPPGVNPEDTLPLS